MSGRYKVLVGSQSGHCCFDYTVVDTLKPHSVYASQGLFDAVCETFSEEEAHAVARALNAATTNQATLARVARPEHNRGEPGGLACLDCGVPYSEFPIDTTLPDEQWRMIHNSEGGLLCASCIVRRASKLPRIVAMRATLEFDAALAHRPQEQQAVVAPDGHDLIGEGYIEQVSALLEAPCVFCGYRGAGYWQRGTHPEGCPWHLVDGGVVARREWLGTIVRALYRAQVLGSLEPVESAHQLTPAEAKSIRLELDFPDLDHLARSGGHGHDLASALRKIDAICNWPDCLDDDEASFELDRAPREASND